MKNRILRALVLAASVVSLASCGSKNCTPAEGTSGATTDNAKVEEKTLTKAFSSPAKVTYNNRRPTYNYYLTTFTFETLEVFSDSSYAFSVSSSTFSALILPEEGTAVQGNERDNSLVTYYGSFTSEADALDEDLVTYHLAKPTRIVGMRDAAYYYDTAAWNDTRKEKTAEKTYEYNPDTHQQVETGSKEYATGDEYLQAKAFASLDLEGTLSTASIVFTALA